MNKKILVLDLDGTLLNSQKEITAKTKAAITNLMEKGHHCMLASGRPTPGMYHIAEELEFSKYGAYLLSFNGAKVIKFDTKEVVYQQKFDASIAGELYDFAKEHNCGILTYNDQEILSGNGVDEYVEIESRINRLSIQELDDFKHQIPKEVNKCLLTAEPELAAKYVELLNDKYKGSLSIYRSEPFFIEVMPQNIDKAATLHNILPLLNMEQKDTVCCGDGYNDISMIEYADIGVAMENARDKVKEKADIITKSNDEDGLIPIIEQYFID